MSEWAAKMARIINKAVQDAQEENRRCGIPNVYVINGTIVWQLPDGTVTSTKPVEAGVQGRYWMPVSMKVDEL